MIDAGGRADVGGSELSYMSGSGGELWWWY